MNKTKIVCTLGPSTDTVELMKQLIQNGMSAARINFSHGTYDSHSIVIENLKQAREELNAPIPLILDTKGPEIRIKTFKEDVIHLDQGSTFTLTTDDIEGDETRVSVTYKNLPLDLQRGSRVLIDDGLIELRVKNLTETDVECQVINGGNLSSRKGVNIPDVYVNLPSLTEKDIEDIKFGIEMGFDYIAASFVRSANDVIKIRRVLEENGGSNIDIISKIENRDGVNNIDEILEVSDGIMVARGDLGVEIPPEEVPLVQKRLIKKSNQKGKPVITATQMLDSMIHNPRPTRAEANDVANAIFDGTDAIMLSGETAKGSYPVESVKMMAMIAKTTEDSIDYIEEMNKTHTTLQRNMTNAISYASCATANDLKASCIITVTNSGYTAKMVSMFRPLSTILACTMKEHVLRQLNLVWGCIPSMFSADYNNTDDVFSEAIQKAVEFNLAKNGDSVVITAGVPIGVSGTTNTLKVHVVGDVLAKGIGIGDKVISGKAVVIKLVEEAEKFFQKGDILITHETNNDFLPYIKKAAALIVELGSNDGNSHAEIVSKALDIPVIIATQNATDLIKNGVLITVDSKKGFVYNGIPKYL